MASKFRRQQQRKRWSDAGTAFPPTYVSRATALSVGDVPFERELIRSIDPLRADSLRAENGAAVHRASSGATSGSPELRRFGSALLQLTSLRSTFAEIPHIKELSDSLDALFARWRDAISAAATGADDPAADPAGSDSSEERELAAATRLYLEILFLENSRPLHRALLSALARTFALHGDGSAGRGKGKGGGGGGGRKGGKEGKRGRGQWDDEGEGSIAGRARRLIERAIALCCSEYGVGGAKRRPFAAAAAGAAITASQFQAPLASSARLVARQLAHTLSADVAAVVDHMKPGGIRDRTERVTEAADVAEASSTAAEAGPEGGSESGSEGGGHVVPATMELCQEALSTLYYLLQRYPEEFTPHSPATSEGPEDDQSKEGKGGDESDESKGVCGELLSVQRAVVRVLQTGVLSRDATVAAAVALCALLPLVQSETGAGAAAGGGGGKAGEEEEEERKEGRLALALARSFFSSPAMLPSAAAANPIPVAMAGSEFVDPLTVLDALIARQDHAATQGAGVGVLDSVQCVQGQGCKGEGAEAGSIDGAAAVGAPQSWASQSWASLGVDGFPLFSQLCCIRGMLTAVPRQALTHRLLLLPPLPQAQEAACATPAASAWASEAGAGSTEQALEVRGWSLLFDGLLPRILSFCEASSDAHSKFHAVTALQICLHQIKTSLLDGTCAASRALFTRQVGRIRATWRAGIGGEKGSAAVAASVSGVQELCEFPFLPLVETLTENASALAYEEMPRGSVERVLGAVWGHWEDPLTQTARQAHVALDLLLDVVQAAEREGGTAGGEMGREKGREEAIEEEKRRGEENAELVGESVQKSEEREGEEEEEAEEDVVEGLGLMMGEEQGGGEGEEGEQNGSAEASPDAEAGQPPEAGEGAEVEGGSGAGDSSEGGEFRQFAEQLAREVLQTGPHRKGRYVPLASLALRLGAGRLLRMSKEGREGGGGGGGEERDSPGTEGAGVEGAAGEMQSASPGVGVESMVMRFPEGVLGDAIAAMGDEGVCCAVSSFLKAFLARLREECWAGNAGAEHEGGDRNRGEMPGRGGGGDVAWRRVWMPAVLCGLVQGAAVHRSNTATYALPVLLALDPSALWPLLAFLTAPTLTPSGVAHLTLHTASAAGSESEPGGLDGLEGSGQAVWEDWAELADGSSGGPHGEYPWGASVDARVGAVVALLRMGRGMGVVDGAVDDAARGGRRRRREGGGEGEGRKGDENGMAEGHEERGSDWSGGPQTVLTWMLERATWHADEAVRVDVAELLCISYRTTAMPSLPELRLLALAFPLNLRCSSPNLRMRWCSIVRRFFARVRAAVERRERKGQGGERVTVVGGVHDKKGSQEGKNREVEEEEGEEEEGEEEEGEEEEGEEEEGASVREVQGFIHWLTALLFASLYPSAPYERKSMALDTLCALMDVWSPRDFLPPLTTPPAAPPTFSPYPPGALWDRLREAALTTLLKYPAPLPGLEREGEVAGVVQWACGLVMSPRVRESDAGALVLKLVFKKYVLGLGWRVRVFPTVTVTATAAAAGLNADSAVISSNISNGGSDGSSSRGASAMLEYLQSLNEWLAALVEEGERDMIGACRHSLVHGVLLLLRYTLEEVDWTAVPAHAAAKAVGEAPAPSQATAVAAAAAAEALGEAEVVAGGMQGVLQRVLALVLRVTGLALWVVAADGLRVDVGEGGRMRVSDKDRQEGGAVCHGGLEGEEEEEEEGDGDAADNDGEATGVDDADDGADDDDDDDDAINTELDGGDSSAPQLAPVEQMVMVACWLSMKEVSLLLGTLARAVPLQPHAGDQQAREADGGGEERGGERKGEEEATVGGELLDAAQLKWATTSSRYSSP
ncbi:hypothetical protein CLOP_g17378 [Closterium sp. NIES-67]|nr:hypothetical protein CLOP_g17378 [Closterium sp. NIES-67]